MLSTGVPFIKDRRSGGPRARNRFREDGRRWCNGCREYHDPAVFAGDRNVADGLRTHCRTHERVLNRRQAARCRPFGSEAERFAQRIDDPVVRALVGDFEQFSSAIAERARADLAARSGAAAPDAADIPHDVLVLAMTEEIAARIARARAEAA